MRIAVDELANFVARGQLAESDVAAIAAASTGKRQPGRRRNRPEDAIQRAVCQFWELAYPETWDKTFHPPNGLAAKSRALAAIFKGLGVKPGVFDLVCISRRGPYSGFALELKAESGRASATQAEWAEHFYSEGWYVVVAFSLERALEAIRAYHAMPRTLPGRDAV